MPIHRMPKPIVTVPIFAARGLLGGARAKSLACAAWLDRTLEQAGISPRLLDQASARVTMVQYLALFTKAKHRGCRQGSGEVRLLVLATHHPVARRVGALALACAVALLAGCGGPPIRGGVPPPAARTQAPVHLDPAEREASVARALLLVNTPYRYGGNTPESGFDCSGLVGYVLAQGTRQPLPRSTAQWAAASAPVQEPQRGDLVFFNTGGGPYSHMGLYVGEGQFVHAPSSGGTVRRDRMDSGYFARRYVGARSVFGP